MVRLSDRIFTQMPKARQWSEAIDMQMPGGCTEVRGARVHCRVTSKISEYATESQDVQECT